MCLGKQRWKNLKSALINDKKMIIEGQIPVEESCSFVRKRVERGSEQGMKLPVLVGNVRDRIY